jgi:LmbE family N-acetylglucosaminyl deacetylase
MTKKIISKKKQNKNSNENIIVIGAHNDDYIIGAGGTLAKYSKEGKNIYSIIFSYGEMSLPQLKRKVSISTRVKESRLSDKIIGIKRNYYLGLIEGKFEEAIKRPEVYDGLLRMIIELKPTKIFMHSDDDAHPDHRAVNLIIKEILDKISFSGSVYTFQIWNFFSFKHANKPKLIVDIAETFEIKKKAFYSHKSQKMVIFTLMWNVYLQAILNGYKNKLKFVEVFYKER